MVRKIAKSYMLHPETGQQLTPGQVYYLSRKTDKKTGAVEVPKAKSRGRKGADKDGDSAGTDSAEVGRQ